MTARTSIAAVPGITVGHATVPAHGTGCTVVLGPPAGLRAAVALRGRATGTREIDPLSPRHLVERIDAICLSGGSAFGLGAADGVMRWLRERGRGLPVGPLGTIPIVPSAVIFDLGNAGKPVGWPGPDDAYRACDAAGEEFAEGAIGAVRMVIVRQFQRALTSADLENRAVAWRADESLGGGLFFEGVGHTLDILDFILGPIAEVHAFADNQVGVSAAEDVVVANLRFASGVYGSGVWCYSSDTEEEYNEIIGSRGTVRFSTTRPVPIRVTTAGHVDDIAIGDPPHVHQPLIQSIVDELNGEGRCPSSGESALRTARVLDAMVRDFRQRRFS